ncbi:MAG: hypothetical protein MI861_27360, partial [Pirellulales bacterium]|nr:hypothetical protein [Pirellulales bacterium]
MMKRLVILFAGWTLLGLAPLTGAAQEGGLLGFFDDLFAPPEPPIRRAVLVNPKMDVNVDINFNNLYTPAIKKVLNRELHFVKKVCQPSDEQFHEIHRAGLRAVAVTSKHYADLQQARKQPDQWPEPHHQIGLALLEAI